MRSRPENPLTVEQVRPLLPAAASLESDDSARGGMNILAGDGRRIGLAVTTLPEARDVVGYVGPTDTLIVFGDDERVRGMAIRRSADTDNHVADVRADREFMAQFDGMDWQQVAAADGEESELAAVSGASMTSRAVHYGVKRRFNTLTTPPPWRWGARDVVAVLAIAGGVALGFRSRLVRRRLRLALAVSMIAGLGFSGGDFVSMSLLLGWATDAVPLRTAPGLVLLVAAALVLPWVTGKAVYCQQICPHGLLQDLIARVSPFRVRVRADVRRGLRWTSIGLLVWGIAAAAYGVPTDFARFEAFDAYLISGAATISVVWAIAGLAMAPFVPRAYCRLACPTGLILDTVRVRPGH